MINFKTQFRSGTKIREAYKAYNKGSSQAIFGFKVRSGQNH
jgi:hypothetical protein